MTFHQCAREKEIAELLRLGHWPDASSAELRAHVAGCRACSDFVLVTRTFRTAHEGTLPRRPFQAAGVLWWRAQLRRQNAAVERINKPIVGAQIFALAVTVLLGVGFAVFQATQGVGWLAWFEGFAQPQTSYVDALRSFASAVSGWGIGLSVAGGAALVLLSGVVLYLATDRQ